jgi:hypothetical protein
MIAFVSSAQVILGERNPCTHDGGAMNQEHPLALLLQPALIRLIDQLRQQMTAASWSWSYDTVELWPDTVSSEVRSQYTTMLQALETASDEEAEMIQDVLETILHPVPLYRLDISLDGVDYQFNLWELCYQICLKEYVPNLSNMTVESPNLDKQTLDLDLYESSGEVDWARLNEKAKTVVSMLMIQLKS